MHFHLYFLYFFLAKYSKFRETDVFFIKAFCSEKISVCVTVFSTVWSYRVPVLLNLNLNL